MQEFDFPVSIIKSNKRKKTITIEIKNMEVIVRAPQNCSARHINKLLRCRQNWIQQKLQQTQQYTKIPPISFKAGCNLPVMGRNYNLQISSSASANIQLQDHNLHCQLRPHYQDNVTVKYYVLRWYRQFALENFTTITQKWALKIGVEPKAIKVRNYKARWGSCSIDRQITYNWRLIMAPEKIIDYVVVHELCHILEHNHSPKFWGWVARYIPHWKDCRAWLKNEAHHLIES